MSTSTPKLSGPYETAYLNRFESASGTPLLRQTFPGVDIAGCADMRVHATDFMPSISVSGDRPVDVELVPLSELAALRAENESLRGQAKATDAARDRVFKAMSEVDYENGKLRAWAEAGSGSFDFGKVYSELLTAQSDRDSLRTQLARCQLDLATSRRERDEAMHAIAWLRNNRINGYDEECAWKAARAALEAKP